MKKRWKTLRFLIASLTALSLSASVAAHDMWIEPTTFVADVGQIVGVRLRIGQDFLGDPLPRDAALIDQFVTVGGAGRKPIAGHEGADPAGLVRIEQPGLLVLGYRSRATPIELTAAAFNKYLEEEGLDAVVATRARRGQANAGTREIFARCAKSLVLSGAPSESDGDRQLGFTLELTAQRNPYTLGAGESLPIALTYEGRPLANALVVAINRRHPETKTARRTDLRGRVAFGLEEDGAWLIKAVHMIQAPLESGAEWASLWASLTFELKHDRRKS